MCLYNVLCTVCGIVGLWDIAFAWGTDFVGVVVTIIFVIVVFVVVIVIVVAVVVVIEEQIIRTKNF